VEITEQELADVLAGNVRVPLADFAEVWRQAEQELPGLVMATPETTWESSYTSAVVGTFRWLACARAPYGPASPPIRVPMMPKGPARRESIQALHEESRFLMTKIPGGYESPGMPPRPGYLEGVRETLGWAPLVHDPGSG
jgi:hypothetical protein